MKVIILIIFIVFSSDYYSQVLIGRVVNSKTEKPISYWGNLVIKGTTIGTQVDTAGNFNLSIDKDDTLVFISLAYPRYEMFNISFDVDTFDIGDIYVTEGISEFVTYRKGFFRRKVKSNCEINLRYDNIKDEDLIINCSNGKFRYSWKRKTVNIFELDFKSIESCD